MQKELYSSGVLCATMLTALRAREAVLACGKHSFTAAKCVRPVAYAASAAWSYVCMRRMSLCAAGAWWVVGRMELCCRGALFAGGRWHFSAAEAGLSKNLRYFAVLKFHKRYFMTVEYHQRNFSTVKSGSHCGAFQGRPSLTLSLRLSL